MWQVKFYEVPSLNQGCQILTCCQMFIQTTQKMCQNPISLKKNGFDIIKKEILFRKRLWHRCFPVNFAKSLRAPFLQNTSGRLLPSIPLMYEETMMKNSFLKCFTNVIWRSWGRLCLEELLAFIRTCYIIWRILSPNLEEFVI